MSIEELAERLTIVAGMFLTSGIFFDVFGYSDGQAHGMIPFGSRENVVVGTSFIGFALTGFFVGFGTKLSNGCTSGHGLCGLARLNLRSAVAVCTFMVTAMAIASLGYYFTLGPISDQKFNPIVEIDNSASANAIIALGVLLPIVSYLISRSEENFDRKSFFKIQVVEYCVGILFGVGLLVSGLTRRAKVMRFLQLGADWDPSLLFVMAVGGLFNLVIFTYVTKKR